MNKTSSLKNWKFWYINIMLFISFVFVSLSIFWILKHNTNENVEIAIVKYILSPIAILILISWIIELIWLSNISFSFKGLKINKKGENNARKKS